MRSPDATSARVNVGHDGDGSSGRAVDAIATPDPATVRPAPAPSVPSPVACAPALDDAAARYPHLAPAAAAMVGAPAAARTRYVLAGRWIGYTRAKRVLARLDELLDHPRTHRMPNLLIVGDTNNGKTAILQRFQALHPASDAPGEDGVVVPALRVQIPVKPDEQEFYDAILGALGAPYRPNDRPARKRAAVLSLLRRTRVRILILDEIHHVLAGNAMQQRQFLNLLKYLGNELEIPLVAAGIQDAFNALQSDPQLSNRFEPVALPRWTFDTEYLRLLASAERLLPLGRPSHLIETSLAHQVLALGEGIIGEIMTLLQRASIEAAASGEERITLALLKELDWVPPSARQRRVL